MNGNMLVSCARMPGHAFTTPSGNRIEAKERIKPMSVFAVFPFPSYPALIMKG